MDPLTTLLLILLPFAMIGCALFGRMAGHVRGYHEGYTDREVGLPRMYDRIRTHGGYQPWHVPRAPGIPPRPPGSE